MSWDRETTSESDPHPKYISNAERSKVKVVWQLNSVSYSKLNSKDTESNRKKQGKRQSLRCQQWKPVAKSSCQLWQLMWFLAGDPWAVLEIPKLSRKRRSLTYCLVSRVACCKFDCAVTVILLCHCYLVATVIVLSLIMLSASLPLSSVLQRATTDTRSVVSFGHSLKVRTPSDLFSLWLSDLNVSELRFECQSRLHGLEERQILIPYSSFLIYSWFLIPYSSFLIHPCRLVIRWRWILCVLYI